MIAVADPTATAEYAALRQSYVDAGLGDQLDAVLPYACCQDCHCRLSEDAVYGAAKVTP